MTIFFKLHPAVTMAFRLSPKLKQELDDIYRQFNDDASQGTLTKATRHINDSVEFGEGEITPLYSLQTPLRKLYNKGEAKKPDIGDHPDFRNLKGTSNIINCSITTLFMDLEGSTRLGLLYSLEDVRRIKNAFIRATIEIVNAFDGHVHRIMGDAVMAFFGGTQINSKCAAIDALNCASIIQCLAENIVRPFLASEKFEDPFGIRIGIDYGSQENVLWSSYGYPGMDEVTATSFYVDVASKLQHSAGRNQIMIGQSLKEFIDVPDDLLMIKTEQKGDQTISQKYLMPNHTDRKGNNIDYKQFLLDWEKYLSLSPLSSPESSLALPASKSSSPLHVEINVYSEENTSLVCNYKPCSTLVTKGQSIRFQPKLSYMPMLPYSMRFKVENHGAEAKEANEGAENLYGNHETTRQITTKREHENLCHLEHTLYRGLHYMTVEIHTHKGITHQSRIGIYIE
jgi:adenylate cyclase